MKRNFDIKHLIRPDLIDIKSYSSARDEFSSGDDMVFLDANENPFNSNLNRYPDPYQSELKIEISKIKNTHSNQILLGNGSDEIIDLLIRLFCIPYQDNILIFPPTYGMYKVVADLNAIRVYEFLLDKNFELDPKSALKKVNKDTKMIFVCTPNNPSGNTIKKDKIIYLLENFKGLVVVDEAYIDFTDQKSFTHQLKDYKNLVVIQTFSKAYGLAGARLGMCLANQYIIEYLNKIKPPYNINSLTQNKVLEQLLNHEDVSRQVKMILTERKKLEINLKNITWVKKIYPSQANFLLVKVDDANKRYRQLLNKNIVVRNRHLQPHCENCLRFTIGTPEENKLFLENLKILD